MKKQILCLAILLAVLTTSAQSYTYGLVRDYSDTGNNYEFTFVVTPDFTNATPEFADMQLSLVISTGNTMTNFTQILTNGLTTNFNLTGSVLQSNFGVGDGTLDLWVFTLPAQSFLVTTAHTAGTPIPVLSFVVANDPTSGTIAILENNDPINTVLGGVGFNADNLVNVDLGLGNQDLYANTDAIANSFNLFDPTLNVDEVTLSKITLFPNPATNSFVVQGITESLRKVSIYDISGSLVKELENYNYDQIDITGLTAGVYFVKLERLTTKLFKLVKN